MQQVGWVGVVGGGQQGLVQEIAASVSGGGVVVDVLDVRLRLGLGEQHASESVLVCAGGRVSCGGEGSPGG